MASSVALKVACLALTMCLLGAPLVQSAITCGQVVSNLAPCVAYVSGRGPLPPACCSGIRNLNAQASTTPDRQAACRCIKSLTQSIRSLKPVLLAGLPGKCGVNLPYKITTSIDCNKIK